MNKIPTKKIEVGQKVWVLRTGGPVQEAVVASVMSVATAGGGENKFIKVEWPDTEGVVLGKTVSIDDVFPRLPNDPLNVTEVLSERQNEALRPDDKVCLICGLSFKGERGLGTHIAKKTSQGGE